MPIDIRLFRYQIATLHLSLTRAVKALHVAEETGRLSEDFHQALASTTPEPLSKDEFEHVSSRVQGDLRYAVIDMLLRSTYVYGWSAFEDLLESCLTAVYAKDPQRLIDRGGVSRNLQLVKRLVVEHWSRDDVIREMIKREVEAFRIKGFNDVPAYFTHQLAVPWRSEWTAALQPVCDRRNSAAHHLHFTLPTLDELKADLHSLMECGTALAMTCSTTHSLSTPAE